MIGVCLVENDPSARRAMAALLRSKRRCLFLGAYANREEALRHLSRKLPDIMVVSLSRPKLSGLEWIRQVKQSYPEVELLALYRGGDGEIPLQALRAGASGCVLKKAPYEEVATGVFELAAGGAPLSRPFVRKVVEYLHAGMARPELGRLSKRELQALEFLAKGQSDKEIAKGLFISSETVRKHLKKVYHKLGVHSRTEAILKYLGY